MIPDTDRTIAAIATPAGRGALGIIRIAGPNAISIAGTMLKLTSGKPLEICPSQSVRRAKALDFHGDAIDDVLVTIFRAPRSYSGDDIVEISAHGGPVTLRRILTTVFGAGAHTAQPGEFTLRAFLNGKMDLAQAEAVADLIGAETDTAARLALRQQSGSLSKRVVDIREIILGVLALIEASIDFPEDVGELDTVYCFKELSKALEAIQRVLKTADAGILYREGARIVLAGRPNVGKSTLMNALLRVSRAIVTPIPGTTRDVLEETFNLRGIPVRAIDTAGIRETDDAVEQIGVQRSRDAIAGADLILLILDSTAGWTDDDRKVQKTIGAKPHLVLWNKADICVASGAAAGDLHVSAETGLHLEELEEKLAELLMNGEVVSDDADEVVVTHVRHREALRSAVKALEQSLESLAAGLPSDFISIDVHGALFALGEITGITTGEDIINEIFARFCIGK